MDLTYLRKYLSTELNPAHRYLWLGLSLLVSLSYSLPVMMQALSGQFIIQDDARQHVTWMRRFLDPDIYPNDLMADYFQAVAPWGYKTFYYLFSQVGFDPILLSKLLPPILALVTTVYFFLATLQLLPSPVAAFVSATLLNQNLWLRDDIVSGTPVAFVYPLFAAFLYYVMRRSLIPYLITLVLLGLFYPQVMLVAGGVLFLRLFELRQSFQQRRLRLADSADLWFYGIGLAVLLAVLLPYALESSPYGPVLTRAEAIDMPAMGRSGWSRFFDDRFTRYWLCGKRSGLLPPEWCDVSFSLPQIGLGILLPFLILARERFPLARQVRPEASIVPHTLVASLGLFLLAHALLFRLHLPNRYGEHSFRMMLALAAGVTVVILLDRLLEWIQIRRWPSWKGRSLLSLSLLVTLVFILLANPYQMVFEGEQFPINRYLQGQHPAIYEFLLSQPKDTRVASIDNEVNNIPSFAERPVFVGGGGYVLPYHKGYFAMAQQRLIEVMTAQYHPKLNVLRRFVQRQGIDYWLIAENFADPGYLKQSVFDQVPDLHDQLKEQLTAGIAPALARFAKRCTVVESRPVGGASLKLLDAACLINPSGSEP